MGKWKHLQAAVLLLLGLTSLPARADMPADPVAFFAHCAGRLSAELSHQWMLHADEADRTEAMHRATLDILSAMTSAEQSRAVLSLRIDARSAHAALLTRAHHRNDAWAARRARLSIAECAAFLVGPTDTPSADPLQGRPPANAVNPASLTP